MDILGIGWQELGMVLVVAAVIAFHIRMLLHLWNSAHGLVFRGIWSGIIIFLPVVGPSLYWFYNHQNAH
jgi:heme/copper-type cytochrome/quinol oxidase subunit 4